MLNFLPQATFKLCFLYCSFVFQLFVCLFVAWFFHWKGVQFKFLCFKSEGNFYFYYYPLFCFFSPFVLTPSFGCTTDSCSFLLQNFLFFFFLLIIIHFGDRFPPGCSIFDFCFSIHHLAFRLFLFILFIVLFLFYICLLLNFIMWCLVMSCFVFQHFIFSSSILSFFLIYF